MSERVIGLRLEFSGSKEAIDVVNALDKALSGVGGNVDELNKRKKALDDLGKELEDYVKTQKGANIPKEQAKITEEIKKTSKAYSDMRKVLAFTTGDGVKNQKTLIKQLATLQQRRREVNKEIEKERRAAEIANTQAGSYRNLNARLVQARNLYREIGEERRNSAEGKGILQNIQELDRELKSLDAEMGQYYRNVGNYISAWDGVKSVTSQFVSLFGVLGGAQEIIQSNAEISDSIANVSKTANISIESAQRLADTLRFRNTRTSLANQLGIAEIGGQLGTAEDDLQGFTAAIDIANVALGDRFNDDASAVASTLGGLRTILQDIQTNDLSNDLLRVGNALNVLEAQGNTTAPVIADFTRRIGGVGQTIGVSAEQTLGLSTALGELQVTAERGGTAVVRILQAIAKEPEKFAKAAGVSVDEFTNLVNTDITEAFLKVSQNVTKNSKSSVEFAQTLDALGLSGSGASEVFSKVGNDVDLVRKRIELAGKAIQSTTSLQDEFDKKNQTLAASIEKVRNSVINLTVNSDFQLFLSTGLDNLSSIINVLAKMPSFIKENKAEFAGLGIAILALNRNLIASRVAVIQSSQAYQLLVSSQARAVLTTRLLGAAQRALPLLAVAAAVFAVIKAIEVYNKRSTAAAIASNKLKDAQKAIADSTGEEINALRQSIDVLQDSNSSTEARTAAIEELQDKYPEYLQNLDLEKASVSELTTLENELTESIIRAAAARQRQQALEEIASEIAERRLEVARLRREGVGFGVTTIGGQLTVASGEFRTAQRVAGQLEELDKLEKAYKETGELFDEAFGLTDKQKKAARQRTNAVASEAEQQVSAVSKSVKDRVRAEKLANDQLTKLRIQAIRNNFDREAASARFDAKNTIANVQGTPSQIDEQTRLISEALDRQLAEIEDRRRIAQEQILSDLDAFNQQLASAQLASQTGGAQSELNSLERQFTIDRTRLEIELAQGLITAEQFAEQLLTIERESITERIAIQQELRDARLAELENELLAEQQVIAEREAERILMLESRFEQDLLSEEQFAQALDQTREFYRQQSNESLRLFYEEQGDIIEEQSLATLELQKLLAEEELRVAEEKDSAILQSRQKTLDGERELINAQYDTLNNYVSGVKSLLQADAKNREQYGGLLKALAIAEIAINLQRQLQNIALSVTQDTAKTGFLGGVFSTAVGAAKASSAIINAAFATAKVIATEFEFGGEINAALAGSSAEGSIQQGSIQKHTKSAVVPRTEGRVVGQSHSQRGVRASYNGSLIELEGGEYLLRNGSETYVINKKSTQRFLGMLNRMKGNSNQYSPAKRALAERINTFNNWGDSFGKFESGGVLGSDQQQSAVFQAINPLPIEALTPNISPLVSSQLSPTQNDRDARIEALISQTIELASIANRRIDDLRVVNDPAETVEFGNEIQAENQNRGL